MKVLCFTASYNRPKFLRSCIQDINNQSYSNLMHSVNITHNAENISEFNPIMISDVLNSKNQYIYTINRHNQINHIDAIKAIPNFMDYDLFAKIDDDDIYKKDYITTIVDAFMNNSMDIGSSAIDYQLNGKDLYFGPYDSLGNKEEHAHYHMPMTFVFNKKALEPILNLTNLYHWEDMLWRDEWTKTDLIHKQIFNNKNVVWNIHGQNHAMHILYKNEINKT